MATSRATRLRSEKFDKNVTKRGNVPVGKAAKREEAAPVSPLLLGFFIFVVVGSAIFSIIQTASRPL
ncbi:Hypothetical protein NocV09_00602170 [Nannochloropsis oceanica]